MHEQTPEVLGKVPKAIDRIKASFEKGEVEEATSILSALHAADQASLLTELDLHQKREILSQLTHEATANILEHLAVEEAVSLLKEGDPVHLSLILDKANSSTAANILRHLPPAQAQEALDAMTEAERVVPLLEHADESAGAIMTPAFIALKERTSAADALALLRKSRPDPKIMDYLFVVDMWNRLSGVVSLSEFILADPNARVANIMDPTVISVPSGTDQEKCARIMEHYDIHSLPVVDQEGRLLGAILMEDLVEVAEEEATEDMYHMVGLSERERLHGPIIGSVRRRLPWLGVNLITVGIAAVVISLFESTIAKTVAVAALLPIVASQGGIAGTQTLTLIVRGLALGEIEFSKTRRLLFREVTLGFINGVVLGLVVGGVAFLWKGNPAIGLAIGIAMALNMVMAGLSGVLIPLGLKLFRVDPALASGVFVTTVTDICGFFFFLGLVALLIPVFS